MINLEQRHSKWMSFAFSQAQKAYDSNEVPVGAVVVYNDKIIGRGHNQKEQLNDLKDMDTKIKNVCKNLQKHIHLVPNYSPIGEIFLRENDLIEDQLLLIQHHQYSKNYV